MELSDREEDLGDNDDSTFGTPLQFAKNHPYLPTAQPLFPEQWIASTNGTRTKIINHCVREENDDEHDGSFGVDNEYDDEENEHCNITTAQQELAVYEIDDIILFPGATLPLRLRDRNWVSHLKSLIDNARQLSLCGGDADQQKKDGTTTTILEQRRMGEVQLVILPRVNYETRRTGR
jgi:hypothetical protein